MCCLFGIHDYGHSLDRRQKNKLLAILATACEARGTDATGIAYNTADRLSIYKRPLPAHKLWFRVPEEARVIMGHTRFTTQGNEKFNYNNHPFPGTTGNTSFALAHNGVLHNDKYLKQKNRLPLTRIETDSYVAVQLLEQKKVLNFDSLGRMAEQLEGSYTIALLTQQDELYIIKGDNPLCLYHYPERGLYLYASTGEILDTALKRLPFSLGTPIRINLTCGEILRLDAQGKQSRNQFDDSKLFPPIYSPWMWEGWEIPVRRTDSNDSYLQDLQVIAACYGIYPADIEELLADGFTYDDIEELIYSGITCH